MHSIEILEINFRKWIPETMAECSREQYLDMAKLVLMYQMAEINLREFRVLAFYSLMNMVPEKGIFEVEEEEKWENIYRASEVLDSFFTLGEDGKMHLVQDYIHNPVKSVEYLKMTFRGPKDSFEGMTYGELEDGIGELNNFLRYGEIESLVKLFAIFYRRPNEKYVHIEKNLEKRVKFFRHLDIRYVYGFYLLFVSFFNYLRNNCVVVVDGNELDLTLLFQPGENQEKPAEGDPETLGLRATSFQLAESGVFGTLPELRTSDAMMVLVRMHDLMMRAKAEEKQRKKMEEEQNQRR